MVTVNGQFLYAFGGAPSCNNPDDAAFCNKQVLASIVGYYDNTYPDVWAASSA